VDVCCLASESVDAAALSATSLVTAMHVASSAGQDILFVYQVLWMASQKEVQGALKSGDLGVHLYDPFLLIQ
jgi:hypothetical protein